MNWRDYGDISVDRFVAELKSVRSPIKFEPGTFYVAMRPHTALGTAMLWVESKYGTAFNRNTPESFNPFNLRPPDGNGYADFDWWTEGAKAWRERITSQTYKGGIYANTVTLEDLINVYAPRTDDNDPDEYVALILAKFAEWGVAVKEAPMPTGLIFGRVPYPDVIESHLDLDNPYVKSGAPYVPDMIYWHRTIGTWKGTNEWFHDGNAATAYGVAVRATDGDNAGKIYEWIAPSSGYYGESSGPVVGPYGDGEKFIAEVGVGNVNRRSKAIEISGNYDTPLDDDSRAAIVAITAFWADQKRIPWDQFPIVPGADRSFVGWHNEITGTAYKACPGSVVMNETSALIARIAQVLKQYQADSKPVPAPTYAAAELPDWWADALAQSWPSDARDGDLIYRVVRRNATAIVGTARLSRPEEGAPFSGPKVAKREKVYVERQLKGHDDKQYFATTDGHYVLASKFTPRVTISSR